VHLSRDTRPRGGGDRGPRPASPRFISGRCQRSIGSRARVSLGFRATHAGAVAPHSAGATPPPAAPGEATLKGLMAAESRRASRDDHTSHSWGIMSLNVSPLYLTAVGRNHSKEKGRPNVSLSRCSVERFCCGT